MTEDKTAMTDGRNNVMVKLLHITRCNYTVFSEFGDQVLSFLYCQVSKVTMRAAGQRICIEVLLSSSLLQLESVGGQGSKPSVTGSIQLCRC